jgi:hypothetical protein
LGVVALVIVAMTIPVMTGCSRGKSPLKGDEVVLAKVDGERITEYDVTHAIRKNFGSYAESVMDDQNRRVVLEGLAQNKAMAQKADKGLSREERALLEKKVSVYRERLLARAYINKNSPPEPVTDEMIERYYRENQKSFGQTTHKVYEMISTDRGLLPGERDKIIGDVGDPAGKTDWKGLVVAMQKKGYPVQYRQGMVNEKMLEKKLQDALHGLKKGAASPLFFVEGKAYALRVTDEVTTPPKPLDEVRESIRKKLKPEQLTKAVRKVSAEVMAGTKVEYFNTAK